MEIIKKPSDGSKKENLFDAIIEVLFESKGIINQATFKEDVKWSVALDEVNKQGADFYFDDSKYYEGEIGERILIKQIGVLLLGEQVDPRPLVGKVRGIFAVKNTVNNKDQEVINNNKPTPTFDKLSLNGVEEKKEETVVNKIFSFNS